MSSDARFWDRASRKYAQSAIADQAGYECTINRTLGLLAPNDRVLELGCGTGTTALRLAGGVKSYFATDISPEMIAIAIERHADNPVPGLVFDTGVAESVMPVSLGFNAVIGFNYLHLVRDLRGTLCQIHALLAAGGLFISKTPCVGDMNVLIRLALPVMRAVGKAPYAGTFRATELKKSIATAGFDILAVESHATKSNEVRPYIVARKR